MNLFESIQVCIITHQLDFINSFFSLLLYPPLLLPINFFSFIMTFQQCSVPGGPLGFPDIVLFSSFFQTASSLTGFPLDITGKAFCTLGLDSTPHPWSSLYALLALPVCFITCPCVSCTCTTHACAGCACISHAHVGAPMLAATTSIAPTLVYPALARDVLVAAVTPKPVLLTPGQLPFWLSPIRLPDICYATLGYPSQLYQCQHFYRSSHHSPLYLHPRYPVQVILAHL